MVKNLKKIKNKKFEKKAISSIIATSLLLIISIISIITFQNWYQNYNSKFFLNFENKIQNSNNIKIEKLVGNSLFLKNQGKNSTILKIKVAKKNCNFTTKTIKTGINEIKLKNCEKKTGIQEIVVFTKNQIIEKNVFLGKQKFDFQIIKKNCSFNSKLIEHNKSLIFYQTSQETFPNICKSENRVCNDSVLSGTFEFENCVQNNCPKNTKMGLCQVCDGKDLSSTIMPNDDSDCLNIDCDKLDTYKITGTQSPSSTSYCQLKDYSDLTNNRCKEKGVCKKENSLDCNSFSTSNVLTAGSCRYISGCSGNVKGVVKNYASGTSCGSNRECNSYGSCISTCESHASYSCYAGNVRWYDSCGDREGVKEWCDNGCSGSRCVKYCDLTYISRFKWDPSTSCSKDPSFCTNTNQWYVRQSCSKYFKEMNVVCGDKGVTNSAGECCSILRPSRCDGDVIYK